MTAAAVGKLLHHTQYRLIMSDVDAAGIAHYANAFRWRDLAFTGWLLAIGRPLSGLLEDGLLLPCVAASAQYLAPTRLDDSLDLLLMAARVGNTSFDLRMEARSSSGDTAVVVESTNVVAARSPQQALASTSMPSWLRDELSHPHGSDPARG
jgi:acyl-CoA thioesterase FadM